MHWMYDNNVRFDRIAQILEIELFLQLLENTIAKTHHGQIKTLNSTASKFSTFQ